VQSSIGIPEHSLLIVGDDSFPRPCRVAWQTTSRIGIAFDQSEPGHQGGHSESHEEAQPAIRAEMLALRASLDQVQIGVVLLDGELRAQFINRAFRQMWQLPDAKADRKPPFVALMYHGRDTLAYAVPMQDIDSYVARRVALVRAGDTNPIDIRRTNGEVLRFQCAVLPNGGRMLSYTCVTDIVRHCDELEVLKVALDRVQEGIVLLDADLKVQFMNRAVRELWKVSDEQAESHPTYADLVADARYTGTYGVAPSNLETFIAQRIARVRTGDPAPQDLRTGDGRVIRSQCTILPMGGRMLTYCDVTDLAGKPSTTVGSR
jgi:PAS domain-containing protein